IVQEALQNCVKHAQCQKAEVSFKYEKKALRLEITDDGVGFDMGKGKKGIGLRNIISRVKKVKGHLDIDSKKGEGTTIRISIPLNYARETDRRGSWESRETVNV
ncbi:MAG: ATP-binding protein, partial [Bacteroidota bacterium]